MKIVRYSAKNGGDAAYGILEDSTIFALEGDLLGEHSKGAEVGSVDDVTLLAPLDPGKIVAIGLNYKAHVTELDSTRTLPEFPVIFMKPQSSVIGPDGTITHTMRSPAGSASTRASSDGTSVTSGLRS